MPLIAIAGLILSLTFDFFRRDRIRANDSKRLLFSSLIPGNTASTTDSPVICPAPTSAHKSSIVDLLNTVKTS